MIIDFLISKDGLRLAKVDVVMTGIRMGRGPSGFVPHAADLMTGQMHIALADLARALARRELIDQLLGGVAGLARPDIELRNGEEPGSIRIVGSVETMGRRIPIKASTRVSVDRNRLTFAATHIEGVPILRAVPVQLFDLVLPLTLPPGLHFTGVTTEPGHVIVAFEGRDVAFGGER